MTDEYDFFNPADPQEELRKAREKGQARARFFAETFGTPSGVQCLAMIRVHCKMHPALGMIERPNEADNAVQRRDALRDFYLWLEGMIEVGKEAEVQHG